MSDTKQAIEQLIADLDDGRDRGRIYTYGQVQERLRAILAAQVVSQPNREAARDALGEIHNQCVTEGGCDFGFALDGALDVVLAALSPAQLTIDRKAARSAIEATEVWRACGFAIDPIIDAVSSVLSAQSAEVPERVASSDESFELGKVAGYDEAMREVAAQPVEGEVE